MTDKKCTCHTTGNCKCQALGYWTTEDGMPIQKCHICGTNQEHCNCGCTCQGA